MTVYWVLKMTCFSSLKDFTERNARLCEKPQHGDSFGVFFQSPFKASNFTQRPSLKHLSGSYFSHSSTTPIYLNGKTSNSPKPFIMFTIILHIWNPQWNLTNIVSYAQIGNLYVLRILIASRQGKARQGKFISIAHFINSGISKFFT